MNANSLKRGWTVLALMAGPLLAAPFDPLFRVMEPREPCQVRLPGTESFEPALKGRAYPFGTTVRTGAGGGATIRFSREKDDVQLGPDTQATPLADSADDAARILRLDRGRLAASLAPATPTNALVVETPVGRVVNLAGRCNIALAAGADAFTLDVQADQGGSLGIVGPQFVIPVLRNGFAVRIVTARDQTYTRIGNTQGDYEVLIDNGTAELLPIRTTTRATVRIWREHAPIGGRLIVSALATDPDGKSEQFYAFAVGRPSVEARMTLRDAEGGVTNALAAGEAALPAPAETEPEAAPPVNPLDIGIFN